MLKKFDRNSIRALLNSKTTIAAFFVVFGILGLSFALRTQAVNELKIQYQYGDTATDTKIKPEMKLVNTTANAISLNDVKIRYWFTKDDATAPTIFCDFATVNCSNLTQNIVSLSTARTNADSYLEIGFTSGANSIGSGANQTIKVRLQKTTDYNDNNDYSFDAAKTNYADSTRVTIYRAGSLIWGTEPGGGSATPTPTPTPTATPTPTPTATPTPNPTPTPTPPPTGVVNVSTASQLTDALAYAAPGQTIQLADGTYNGRFVASMSGTSSSKITLQGSRNAVLNGGSTGSGYGFYLTASHWKLVGFTVTNSQKGIMLDGANNNLLNDLRVYNIGHEAVHFRKNSSFNTIQNSLITDTGKTKPDFGEGVYLGSANSNWVNGQPDRSDSNQVLDNDFGPNIAAEHIDIKEGTTGGTIRGNMFNGVGIAGANSADSWVDVKGNNYTISYNIGNNTSGLSSLVDGFQTHILYAGFGNNNVFSNNTANVNASGYGFNIQLSGSRGTATGNIVYSNNTATNAASGLANMPVTP
ncbi:MAG: hypothetical protein H7Z37_18015 [Pyrinomonadaceae bacterium]|nr:hypothetical protein [Pyrinomonadaceae bacterium]